MWGVAGRSDIEEGAQSGCLGQAQQAGAGQRWEMQAGASVHVSVVLGWAAWNCGEARVRTWGARAARHCAAVGSAASPQEKEKQCGAMLWELMFGN